MSSTRKARKFRQRPAAGVKPAPPRGRPCDECGQPLQAHPRCTVCDLFVWCTDPRSIERRHMDCPVSQ